MATPYILPDGQRWRGPVSVDSAAAAGARLRPGARGARGKDSLWAALLRGKTAASSDAELAELRAIERVGLRRRRRWLNDKALRDLAGPISAAEMAGLFSPPPFGAEPPPSAFAAALGSRAARDVMGHFLSVDEDREARVLQAWQEHNRELRRQRRPPPRGQEQQRAGGGGGGDDAAGAGGGGGGHARRQQQEQAAAAAALARWARVPRAARAALKRADPHSVLQLEIAVLEQPAEPPLQEQQQQQGQQQGQQGQQCQKQTAPGRGGAGAAAGAAVVAAAGDGADDTDTGEEEGEEEEVALLSLPDGFARLLAHGLARFHGLRSSSVSRGGERLVAVVRRRRRQRQRQEQQESAEQPAAAAAAVEDNGGDDGGEDGNALNWLDARVDVTATDVLLALRDAAAGGGLTASALGAFLRAHVHGSHSSEALSEEDFVFV